MIEIDLIRHVKVSGEAALYGSNDVAPIVKENARLLERLIALQQTTKAYQSIVCSPLIRCQHLAKQFSERCKLPLEISPNLQEMDFGSFDGVPFDNIPFSDALSSAVDVSDINSQDIELHWSQLEAFFQAPAQVKLPKAESLADFHYRVIQAWQMLITKHINIARQQKELKTPQRILVIVHGGVIRMILAHILQLDWRQAGWHQKLQIDHGSLSQVCVSQPYQYEEGNQPHLQSNQQSKKLHQQVKTIAMPFLEGF